MNVSDLKPSRHKGRLRAGRGISAGQGKTAGRGTKGQNSRSGGQRNPGFEGGQNPLLQRVPKQRGFRSHRAKLQTVKTSDLNKLRAGAVDHQTLLKAGLVKNSRTGAKLLYDAPATKQFKVSLQSASQNASDSLTKAGGSFTKTPLRTVAKAVLAAEKATAKPSKAD
jgi:large subunit ribosomal protein L15